MQRARCCPASPQMRSGCFPSVLEAAADCVLEWERHGIIDAMNRCNRAPQSENGSAPPIEER